MTLLPLLLSVAWFAPAHAGTCSAYAAPFTLATVNSSDLTESSGLAPSMRRPGVWYTHNDSGDGPVLYAFNLAGELLGEYQVGGASATDWEDMAAGRCPVGTGSCLYVGDIGDNSQVRSHVTIYAIPEPAPGRAVQVQRSWDATYPDGARNAETLLVHPSTGQIFIVTKDTDGHSDVYRVPTESADNDVVLEHVVELEFSGSSSSDRKAVAGNWHPDGTRLAIRTYNEIYEWETDPQDPEAHWGDEPTIWSAPVEAQGESLAYMRQGPLV